MSPASKETRSERRTGGLRQRLPLALALTHVRRLRRRRRSRRCSHDLRPRGGLVDRRRRLPDRRCGERADPQGQAGRFPGGGGSLDTKITKGPKKKTHKRKVKLSFTAVPAGSASSFLCKLDKKPFKACKSPKKYKRLKRGMHVFKVAAADADGNSDPSPAVRKFKVVKKKRRHA